MKQTGYAYAFGAGTIINAISTWKGAAFSIDLKTEAEVILTDNKKIIGYMEEGVPTFFHIADYFLIVCKYDLGFCLKVYTKSCSFPCGDSVNYCFCTESIGVSSLLHLFTCSIMLRKSFNSFNTCSFLKSTTLNNTTSHQSRFKLHRNSCSETLIS